MARGRHAPPPSKAAQLAALLAAVIASAAHGHLPPRPAAGGKR